MDNQIRLNNNQTPQMKNMGYIKPGPKWIHPDRVLDYHDFLYIVNGTFEVWEEETEYILEKGDILFLKAGLHHFGEKKNSIDVEWYYVHFYLEDSLPPLQTLEQNIFNNDAVLFNDPTQIVLPKYFNIPVHLRSRIINMLKSLLNSYWHLEPLKSFFINMNLLELLMELVKIEHQTQSHDKLNYLALKIKQYLDGITNEPFHSLKIAKELDMNYNYLSTVFRKQTGLSPKEYHTMVRIKEAASMLERQEGSISEISSRLSFESIYHFSRVFKKILGVPPREYVNQIYIGKDDQRPLL